MLKVAIIGTRGYPSYYGGFETAVRKIAPHLAELGWEVTVYGREGTTDASHRDHDPRVRSVVTRGIETKSLSTLSYGLTAVVHASTRRPNAVLVMNVANGFWLPILKVLGIPTLVNVDGIEWDRDKWGRFAKAVFKAGAWMSARFATDLVHDSRAIGERWQRDFGRSGEFIPYGGELADSCALEEGLVEHEYVLMVARFVPENTVAEFLAAVPSIAEHRSVVLIGSTGYGGHFDELAAKLSREHVNVHWFGHVSDDKRLHALWQNAGLYFHGHSVGGTNPALVQAMASGAAILARDTIYNREVLAAAGLYVSADPQSIATAVEAAFESPERLAELRARARSRAASDYSWDSVVSAYASGLARIAR